MKNCKPFKFSFKRDTLMMHSLHADPSKFQRYIKKSRDLKNFKTDFAVKLKKNKKNKKKYATDGFCSNSKQTFTMYILLHTK